MGCCYNKETIQQNGALDEQIVILTTFEDRDATKADVSLTRIDKMQLSVDGSFMLDNISSLFEKEPNCLDGILEKWIERETNEKTKILSEIKNTSYGIPMTSEYLIEWKDNIDFTVIANNYDTKSGTYSGQIKNSLAHGIGRFKSNRGKLYEGQFQNGKAHGYIRMIYGVGHMMIGT